MQNIGSLNVDIIALVIVIATLIVGFNLGFFQQLKKTICFIVPFIILSLLGSFMYNFICSILPYEEIVMFFLNLFNAVKFQYYVSAFVLYIIMYLILYMILLIVVKLVEKLLKRTLEKPKIPAKIGGIFVAIINAYFIIILFLFLVAPITSVNTDSMLMKPLYYLNNQYYEISVVNEYKNVNPQKYEINKRMYKQAFCLDFYDSYFLLKETVNLYEADRAKVNDIVSTKILDFNDNASVRRAKVILFQSINGATYSVSDYLSLLIVNLNQDTDGDGMTDYDEIMVGRDPNSDADKSNLDRGNFTSNLLIEQLLVDYRADKEIRNLLLDIRNSILDNQGFYKIIAEETPNYIKTHNEREIMSNIRYYQDEVLNNIYRNDVRIKTESLFNGYEYFINIYFSEYVVYDLLKIETPAYSYEEYINAINGFLYDREKLDMFLRDYVRYVSQGKEEKLPRVSQTLSFFQEYIDLSSINANINMNLSFYMKMTIMQSSLNDEFVKNFFSQGLLVRSYFKDTFLNINTSGWELYTNYYIYQILLLNKKTYIFLDFENLVKEIDKQIDKENLSEEIKVQILSYVLNNELDHLYDIKAIDLALKTQVETFISSLV